MDEELAEATAGNDGEKFTYRFSEWTPIAEILAAIHEQLQNLTSVTVMVAKGKPNPIVRWPRPVGAAHKAHERRKWEEHERIVAMVLPSRQKPPD